MASSTTPINFYSMAPAAQDILLRIADTKDYIEYICEFLDEMRCSSVVMIRSLSLLKSKILTSFGEFVTTRLKSNTRIRAPHPLFVKFASSILNKFIDDCVDSCKGASSSLCRTPVGTATPELKRRSSISSSSLSPPNKKAKILHPATLLHLSVDHPQFWQYLIVFTSLLATARETELACPGCGKMHAVTYPHNFYTHVLSQHDVLSDEATTGCVPAPPAFPPAGDHCHRDMLTLSEHELTHVPLPWLAAIPITSLPASIQVRVRAHTESLAQAKTSAATVLSPASLQPQEAHNDDDLQWPTSVPGL